LIKINKAFLIDDPGMTLEEVSNLDYIRRHGLSDYTTKMSTCILYATLRKDQKLIKSLEVNLELLTNLYLKGMVYEPELVSCETLILFLANSIGMIRAENDMDISSTVKRCMRLLGNFQDKLATAA